MSQPRVSAELTAADYAVFGVTLGISAVIGIFFAIKARKSRDGLEGYMMGGRWVNLRFCGPADANVNFIQWTT